MNLTLRPYQADGIEQIRASYRRGARAVLLQSPTGSGKTVMFAYITGAAARKGSRVVILVHRQELLAQTSRALFSIGVAHGLIASGKSSTLDHVQVASVQTLVRRLHRVPRFDLIIIDEAHHTAAGSWRKILDAQAEARLLGVTATPERLDGKGLGIQAGGYFDTLVNGPTVTELVNKGYLSKPVVYAPPTPVDLSGLHRRYGDYVTSETVERMDKPTITGCAVTHYKKICPGVPAIAFCASVKHAEHVATQFNEAGIPSASIDGTLDDTSRNQRIDDLGSGRISVLTSCEIVSEGTDIPVVTAAILLRPTQSTGLHLQQCGRALRPHPDKRESIILDNVGNTFKHGFPDDERDWTLDGEKRHAGTGDGNGPSEFVQCENCYLIFHRTDPACPKCGWVRPVQEREIEQVDGELSKVDDLEKERIRIHMKREVGQARTREALQEIARQRGYHHGWVEHVLRARQNREVVYDR